jgi:uncharacterized membrane protein YadS
MIGTAIVASIDSGLTGIRVTVSTVVLLSITQAWIYTCLAHWLATLGDTNTRT